MFLFGFKEVSPIMKNSKPLTKKKDGGEKLMVETYLEDYLEHGPIGDGNMDILQVRLMP